jgi:hypothetical protein
VFWSRLCNLHVSYGVEPDGLLAAEQCKEGHQRIDLQQLCLSQLIQVESAAQFCHLALIDVILQAPTVLQCFVFKVSSVGNFPLKLT